LRALVDAAPADFATTSIGEGLRRAVPHESRFFDDGYRVSLRRSGLPV